MTTKVTSITSGTIPYSTATFSNLGNRTLAVADPPRGDGTALAKVLKEAKDLTRKLDETAGSGKAKRLHVDDLAKLLKPERDAAIAKWRDLGTLADKQANETAMRRIALLQPPQLQMSDAVGASMDAEIRSSIARLPKEQRSKLLNQVAGGEQVRIRDALCRSPFTTPESQLATAAWQAARSREVSNEMRECDDADVESEWAASAATSAERIVYAGVSDLVEKLLKTG